jgi:hypothetical protein
VNSEIKDEDFEVGMICVVDESGEELGMIRLLFSLDILRGDVRENLSRLWAGSTYAYLQETCDQVMEIITECERRNPEFIVWKELMTDEDSSFLVGRFSELDPSNIVHRTFARMIMEGPGTDDVGKLDVWLKVTREEEYKKAALQFRESPVNRLSQIHPWEHIPDEGRNREIVERWCAGQSAQAISQAVFIGANTVYNILSDLRNLYPEACIPYGRERKRMRF